MYISYMHNCSWPREPVNTREHGRKLFSPRFRGGGYFFFPSKSFAPRYAFKINYVNMQRNYFHLLINHVNMKHNYVDMQCICLCTCNFCNMRENDVEIRLKLCCTCCMLTINFAYWDKLVACEYKCIICWHNVSCKLFLGRPQGIESVWWC